MVDLNDILEKAAIKDLPYHLRPQPALFQLLAAANKSAQEAVPVRKAYTYVEFNPQGCAPSVDGILSGWGSHAKAWRV